MCRALVVVDGADHHAGPETGAVLADPPPFLGVRAVTQSGLEIALGVSVGPLVRRVEDPVGLADDLARCVSLDALCPGVPAGDVALDIEHVDRVLTDRRHQEPEVLLGDAQADLGGAQLADVLDLGEDVEHLTPHVADRGQGEAGEPGGAFARRWRHRMLDGGQVLAGRGHPLECPVQLVAGPVHQPAVVDPDQVVRRAGHQVGERVVGPYDGAVHRQGGHPDGCPVEQVLELRDVLVEHRLLGTGRAHLRSARADRRQPVPRASGCPGVAREGRRAGSTSRPGLPPRARGPVRPGSAPGTR